MFGDDQAATDFEAFMDDDGNLPGDDSFEPTDGPDDTEAFEAHVEEFDEDGNPVVEPDAGEDDEDADGEDDEAESDGDGDESDGDEGASDANVADEDKLYDITIDGDEYEVNLHELTSGYLRNEDYVKRSTDLESTYSEKLAEVDTQAAALAQELEAVAVLGVADLEQYETIDWERMKVEAPELYNTKRVEYMDKREAVQSQINRKDSVQRMLAEAAAIKQRSYLESQKELVAKLIPDFGTPEFGPRLYKYAESIGFSQEEVNDISDARQLLVLENARKFAEGQLKRKATLERKPTKELPAVIKPGSKAPVVDRDTKRHKAAVSRLRDEGTLDAAAAAFLDYV